jgi:hypothetical protein
MTLPEYLYSQLIRFCHSIALLTFSKSPCALQHAPSFTTSKPQVIRFCGEVLCTGCVRRPLLLVPSSVYMTRLDDFFWRLQIFCFSFLFNFFALRWAVLAGFGRSFPTFGPLKKEESADTSH